MVDWVLHCNCLAPQLNFSLYPFLIPGPYFRRCWSQQCFLINILLLYKTRPEDNGNNSSTLEGRDNHLSRMSYYSEESPFFLAWKGSDAGEFSTNFVAFKSHGVEVVIFRISLNTELENNFPFFILRKSHCVSPSYWTIEKRSTSGYLFIFFSSSL